MGKKRANKDPGRVRQIHPQKSFDQMVAETTLQKFRPYIDQQLQGVAGALAQQQQQQFENVYLRQTVLEQIVEEKLGITKEELANRVASVQDESLGLVPVKDVAEGDRVRIEIKTKTKDQEEFQGESRLLVDNVGSGNTLGPELEKPLVGMTTGESKEIAFGKEKAMTALVTINRVSRRPKVEEAASEEAAAAEAEEAPAQEAANDSNAG